MSSLVRSLAVPKEKGVPHRQLWELTHWDKRFNGVANHKQVEVRKYSYLLASELKALATPNGSIKLLNTGADDFGSTTPELAGDKVANGEIICVPWGGTPSVQYHAGDFVTADNRIAVSRDTGLIRTRFLYYALQAQMPAIAKTYRGSGIKHPDMNELLNLTLPVPPIETQDEIITFLGHFEDLDAALSSELEARKIQLDEYTSKLLDPEEFSEVEWLPLGDLISYEQPGAYLVSSKNYSPSFETPVLTAGKTFILGFTDELDGIYPASKSEPVIIFDDFTTSMQWVDFPFKAKSSAMKMLTANNSEVSLRYLWFQMKTIDYTPFEHSRQWIGTYSNFLIPVPPIKEQLRVVEVLNKLEALVGNIDFGLPAEIAARRKQYEYYRDQLLTFKDVEK
jgi:type I restriction enzyme S subunit